MKLIRAKIKNFRSIGDVDIDFEPRLRTLVGVNEAGKSNILAALALLDPERSILASDVREPRSEEAPGADSYVRFILQLDSAEKAQVKTAALQQISPIDMPLLVSSRKVYSGEEIMKFFSQGIYQVNIRNQARSYTRWSIPSSTAVEGWLSKLAGATLPNPLLLKNGKKLSSDALKIIHSSVLKDEDKGFFEPASLEMIENIFDTQLKIIIKTYLPACMYWTYSESNLLPSQISISEFRTNPNAFLPLKEMFALAELNNPDEAFSEYEKRPHGLRNLLQRVSLAATKHIERSWPESKGVQILLSANGEHIDASIKDAHNYYAFDKRSDGFKRFISFLFLVAARIKNGTLSNVLFLQDEPDLGLHPSGVKHLLSSLIELSDNNYAVVATHSIFLVDKERVDRHLIIKKHEELTSVVEIQPSNINEEEVIYNALGYSLFDSLKPKNIVFEGWRDKRLFITAANKRSVVSGQLRSMMKANLGLCHAKGLRDISRVSTFLQLAGRKGIAVVDSDEPGRQMQKAEQDHHVDWHRYDELCNEDVVYTAEDFISPSRLSSALNLVAQENGYVDDATPAMFTGVSAVDNADNWLKAKGIAKDDIKRLINAWKSEIFDNLKVSEIVDKYGIVQTAIKSRIDQLP